MKIKAVKPVTILIGTQRTTVLPHHQLKVEAGLGRKLLKLHAGVLKRVR